MVKPILFFYGVTPRSSRVMPLNGEQLPSVSCLVGFSSGFVGQ